MISHSFLVGRPACRENDSTGICLVGHAPSSNICPSRHSTFRAGRPSSKGMNHREVVLLLPCDYGKDTFLSKRYLFGQWFCAVWCASFCQSLLVASSLVPTTTTTITPLSLVHSVLQVLLSPRPCMPGNQPDHGGRPPCRHRRPWDAIPLSPILPRLLPGRWYLAKTAIDPTEKVKAFVVTRPSSIMILVLLLQQLANLKWSIVRTFRYHKHPKPMRFSCRKLIGCGVPKWEPMNMVW